jgi:hypothetical protein
MPLILKYQGTGKIHSIVQSQPAEQESSLYGRVPALQLDLDGYMGLIQFGREWAPVVRTEPLGRGGCLVIQASKKEFYMVGINSRLLLRPKATVGKSASVLLSSDMSHPSFCNYVVSVDEGHFDEKGEYVIDRRCNGDLTRGGVWVASCDTVMRVITCD